MKGKILNSSQLEQFMELGWVKVEEAFSRNDAFAAQDVVWQHVEERGVRKDDRSTWTQPRVHLKEAYDTPEFRACNTERLADAIEDLVGPGRWKTRGVHRGWGWWPVNFSVGAESPWTVPTVGWHWDGIQFRHRLNSPDQGLLCLCIFSDVGEHAGGTVVAEGSHKVVARFLAGQTEPVNLADGIYQVNHSHPWIRSLVGLPEEDGEDAVGSHDVYNEAQPSSPNAEDQAEADARIHRFMQTTFTDEHGVRLRVIETQAQAGDVILCHPFLYHAAAQNHSGNPRFMCNRTTPLVEDMNFHRQDGAYSVLEQSIKSAIPDLLDY